MSYFNIIHASNHSWIPIPVVNGTLLKWRNSRYLQQGTCKYPPISRIGIQLRVKIKDSENAQPRAWEEISTRISISTITYSQTMWASLV